MRRILPLLALAACGTPARTGRSGAGAGDGTAAATDRAGEAREAPAAPVMVDLAALVPHLAPGDPVRLAIRFGREVGTVTRIDPLEAALARPDGTTQRARIAVDVTSWSFELATAGRLDFSLAGRYRLSLAGVAHGAAPHRFVCREIELEVMGDGRLPLAEIERRARGEFARRHPGVTPDQSLVVEGPDGMRAVLFAAGTTARLVRVTPGGAIRGVDAARGDGDLPALLWGWPAP